MWTTYENFVNVVSQNWAQPCPFTGLKAFSFKLKRHKPVLKKWNWNKFGDVFRKLNSIKVEIVEMEENFGEEWLIKELKKDWIAIVTRRDLL